MAQAVTPQEAAELRRRTEQPQAITLLRPERAVLLRMLDELAAQGIGVDRIVIFPVHPVTKL